MSEVRPFTAQGMAGRTAAILFVFVIIFVAPLSILFFVVNGNLAGLRTVVFCLHIHIDLQEIFLCKC